MFYKIVAQMGMVIIDKIVLRTMALLINFLSRSNLSAKAKGVIASGIANSISDGIYLVKSEENIFTPY